MSHITNRSYIWDKPLAALDSLLLTSCKKGPRKTPPDEEAFSKELSGGISERFSFPWQHFYLPPSPTPPPVGLDQNVGGSQILKQRKCAVPRDSKNPFPATNFSIECLLSIAGESVCEPSYCGFFEKEFPGQNIRVYISICLIP